MNIFPRLLIRILPSIVRITHLRKYGVGDFYAVISVMKRRGGIREIVITIEENNIR